MWSFLGRPRFRCSTSLAFIRCHQNIERSFEVKFIEKETKLFLKYYINNFTHYSWRHNTNDLKLVLKSQWYTSLRVNVRHCQYLLEVCQCMDYNVSEINSSSIYFHAFCSVSPSVLTCSKSSIEHLLVSSSLVEIYYREMITQLFPSPSFLIKPIHFCCHIQSLFIIIFDLPLTFIILLTPQRLLIFYEMKSKNATTTFLSKSTVTIHAGACS